MRRPPLGSSSSSATGGAGGGEGYSGAMPTIVAAKFLAGALELAVFVAPGGSTASTAGGVGASAALAMPGGGAMPIIVPRRFGFFAGSAGEAPLAFAAALGGGAGGGSGTSMTNVLFSPEEAGAGGNMALQ